MKLIIDIGNTMTKLVAFDGNEPIEMLKQEGVSIEGVAKLMTKYQFSAGILGTVRDIPQEVEAQIAVLPFPILRFTSETPIPITNRYRTPQTLGADRLAAAVGACTIKPGCDLLIIDAGTCITYEVIDAEGNYWGGNIAPGMQMRLRALHEFTARLPYIQPDGDVPGMGYDTETAIRSGVLRGMKYEIEGYIRSMLTKYPGLMVFLTGGNRIKFDTTITDIIIADQYIVPRGLNRILDYNQTHDR